VRIVVAANDKDVIRAFPRRPLVIATEYPCIASRWAMGENLAHIILQTYGSTEGYVPGSADLAIDCIDTGDTMRANGLVEIAEITRSSTHLIVNRLALAQNRLTPLIDALINGVNNAKWAGDA
jgi:ATP phosphoribosyltransferase